MQAPYVDGAVEFMAILERKLKLILLRGSAVAGLLLS